MMKMTPAIEFCSSLLILLFTYAAFSKLLNLQQFEATIEESTLIHNRAGTIARPVPITGPGVVLLLFFLKAQVHACFEGIYDCCRVNMIKKK